MSAARSPRDRPPRCLRTGRSCAPIWDASMLEVRGLGASYGTHSALRGGEEQMVGIGRGLMSAPKLLRLDEPSLGLSPLLCGERFGALAQIRQSGTGILLVEQNAIQGLNIADRGYLIETGRIVGQ